MRPICVLYATREGHTRKTAEHVGAVLRTYDMDVDIINLHSKSVAIDLSRYAAALLVGSLHFGKHEPEMTAFVKQHRNELNSLPTAFLSVSLSEAVAERPGATARERLHAVVDVERAIKLFCTETGWYPQYVKPIAGALMYSKYNVLVRWVMKHLAKKNGGDTDTSRDYDYTDWAALEEFVETFAAELPAEAGRNETPALSQSGQR